MDPLFSVIVPVYNAEKYISECLDSILNQTFPFLEIVACNDGSTDNSLSVLNSYHEKDERVKVLSQENKGVSEARQTALEACKGLYIVCVDADDKLEENCFEEFAKAIDVYDADIVCCGFKRLNKRKTKNEQIKMPFGFYDRHKVEQVVFPIIFEPEYDQEIKMTLWGKAVRKEIFAQEHAALDKSITLGEDNAVIIPCFYRANSIVVLPQCLYDYRMSDTSVINNGKPRSWNMLKLKAIHLKKRVDINTFALKGSYYRSIVHSFFNVAITQFYGKEKNSVIKQEISAYLEDPLFKDIIDKCAFPKHTKGNMVLKALRNKSFLQMSIYSRIKKGRF